MTKPYLSSRARRQARCGVSLLEALVALSLLIMVGIAFMTMYTSIITTGGRVTAVSYTALDASNTIDRITLALREARRFEFMDSGTSGPTQYQTLVSGQANSNPNYLAKDASGNIIAVTGIHIVFPAAHSAITVATSASGATATLSGATALADYRTDGAYLDVYRSDEHGIPAPSNGKYLWMRGTLNGGTIPTDAKADRTHGIDGEPLVKDIADWDGAVQFIRGQVNEVQIKVVTTAYDRVSNNLTSESTQGTVTSLTAEHVYLRNHDPNGVTVGSVHGQTLYSGS